MRGGSRGGRKVRPTLPFKLTKELGGDGDSRGSHRGGRGGGGSFKRKNRRKEEREAKKHKPRSQFTPREDVKPSKSPAERHNKRPAPTSDVNKAPFASAEKKKKFSNTDDAGKHQKKELSKPSRPGGSRFNELVQSAEDPEKVLQRELARKLGIKKKAKTGKKIKFGDDGDGMDELMAELGGIDDILNFSGSDGEEEKEEEEESGSDGSETGSEDENEKEEQLDDKAYLKMKKQKAAKAAAAAAAKKYSVTASSGSDSEEEEDLEDLEEESEESEEDDSHLGGLSEMNHEHDDLGFEISEEESSEEESSGDDDSDGERMLDSSSDDDDEEEEKEEEEEEEKNEKPAVAAASGGKYVPPAVRRAQLAAAGAATAAANQPRSRDEEVVMRRVRGLLNRMAETNVQGIVGELAELYQNEGRSVVGNAVATELLTAAAEGPRASDRFAAVAAAAISGLAGLTNSPGVIATFSEKIAIALEKAMAPADDLGTTTITLEKNKLNSSTDGEAIFSQGDSLAAGNLVQVLAHLYLSGALKSDLIYSLLDEWRVRFLESDVVAMAGLLGAAGLALRAADPERMKEFVVAVHTRAAEFTNSTNSNGAAAAATATATGTAGKMEKNKKSKDAGVSSSSGGLSTRARVMLDLVVDIKNNRKRQDGRRKAVQLDPAAAKWLRGCNVGAVALGGITWKKVLTGDKRGHWWMPTAADAAATLNNTRSSNKHGGDSTILITGSGIGGAGAAAVAAGIGSDAGLAAAELLKLASAMHMNTDSRRAVFCAIMGSEDAVDAFEKLLRLGLKGDQEREIVRVTVECCLNEAAYNPYYAQLLISLCNVAKGHKITLQYCLWDHFVEVPSMNLRRMTNLARLTATCISSTCIPITMLKSVDFEKAFSAREVLFWRLFFEFCLAGCKSDADVATIFSKIALQQQLGALKLALGAFVKRSVGPWLANRDVDDPSSGGTQRMAMLLRRCRLAERALLTKI